MRDAQTYRGARRNAWRQQARDQAVTFSFLWRWGAETAVRNDGFRMGWHISMEPSPMGSGVPKPKPAVLTEPLAEAAE